jgi:cyclohexanecarboxylate-CoA ligase
MSGPRFDERICAETDGSPITADCEARLDEAVDGVGELLLRGPQMFLGYLDASLNEEAFAEDGFFRSGDLARIGPQGEVTIVGRKKDVILRGGENISAKQVEDALYRHPSVREIAVVAMPDPVLVERVCAFVVPAGDAPPTLAQLTAHLEAEGLAKQKWPERLEIATELPMTPSGKIQKFKLRQQVREQMEREAARGTPSSSQG